MGTRHLIAVYYQGAYRVAQYGQWDGYLSGQGADILAFLHKVNAEPSGWDRSSGWERFKANLLRCVFIPQEKVMRYYEEVGAPKGAQFINMVVADRFKERHPQLDRDMGAGILTYIHNHPGGDIELSDELAFAGDGLFCEYAYVIDLDRGAFEVYTGFRKSPGPEGERFADMYDGGEYYPVQLLATFPLTTLPTKAAFVKLDK